MVFMTKPGAIIKIQILQGSNAKDYFESKERLFLVTVISKLQNDPSEELNLSNAEKNMLKMIFDKYKKYL